MTTASTFFSAALLTAACLLGACDPSPALSSLGTIESDAIEPAPARTPAARASEAPAYVGDEYAVALRQLADSHAGDTTLPAPTF